MTAGIICEYNPMHLGHVRQIEQTRRRLGEGTAIVCVMSGNFVQRGEPAVFNKHARAESAVRSGVDLVIELPVPNALTSAEGFARAGVWLLAQTGVEVISFGSESGDIRALTKAAEAIASPEAGVLTREGLACGISYAMARQKAADAVLGADAEVFRSPNNLLGIEYLRAISELGLSEKLQAVTIKRAGGAHDDKTGLSSAALRARMTSGERPWKHMPNQAAGIYLREIAEGRGPVTAELMETAALSRLRMLPEDSFALLPGASEGLERRLSRAAATEPALDAIAYAVKSKRYAMSRIRRMIFCACLGITADDAKTLPLYIRVLAMNKTGMRVLKEVKSELPVITKPASVRRKLSERARKLFYLEAAATDFYSLAYRGTDQRTGGQEFTVSPRIIT